MTDRQSAGATHRLCAITALLIMALVGGGGPFSAAAQTSGAGHMPLARGHAAAASTLPAGFLSNIQGATYDQQTHDIILIGNDIASYPAIDTSNLTVALRTRFDAGADAEQLWPGVSIDFSTNNPNVMD